MTKIRKIRLHPQDLHKLKKYGFLRVGNYAISLDEINIQQVKTYGNPNG